MNANGSAQVQLTVNKIEDISAAWSPDGTKISLLVEPGRREQPRDLR